MTANASGVLPRVMPNGTFGKEFHQELVNILTTIVTRLQCHCGPLGKFAVRLSPVAASMYTMDGLHIMQSWKSDDLLVRALVDEFEYIGHNVENTVGDGTTSAMLFAAAFALSIMQHPDRQRELCCNYHVLLDLWEEVQEDLENLMDRGYTITIDRLLNEKLVPNTEEAVNLMAFWQSLCSSHGDEELSAMVADLFSSLPKDAWPFLTFRVDNGESKERIRFEEAGFNEFTLSVAPTITPTTCSEDSDYYGFAESELIVAVANPLTQHPSMDRLRDMVNQALAKNPEGMVTIITTQPTDQATRQELVKLIHEHQPRAIALMTYLSDFGNEWINDLSALIVTAGNEIPQELVNPVWLGCYHMRLRSNELTIYEMYGNPDEAILNPNVGIPGNTVDRFLAMVEKRIALHQDTKGSDLVTTATRIRYYQQLYLKVKYTRLHRLVIGGSVHDITGLVDVVTDCLKATRSTLTCGLQPGSNLALLLAIDELGEQEHDNPSKRYLLDALRAATYAVIDGLLQNADPAVKTKVQRWLTNLQHDWVPLKKEQEPLTFLQRLFHKPLYFPVEHRLSWARQSSANGESWLERIPFLDLQSDGHGATWNTFRDYVGTSYVPGDCGIGVDAVSQIFPPVQSAALCSTMLTRVKEVVLRLLNTDSAIITDAR